LQGTNSNCEINLVNFWYEFDNEFTYHPTPEIELAKRQIDPEGDLFTFYLNDSDKSDFSERVRTKYLKQLLNFRILSDRQLSLLDKHFQGNKELERLAFEEFAQGTLFDNLLCPGGIRRRSGTESIHMMNSSLLGYIIWHAFIQILLLIDKGADHDRWLEIERYLVLSADILLHLISLGREPKPYSSIDMHNIRLEFNTLQKLRYYWMYKGYEEINHKMRNLIDYI
jgi:hypothetical protein